MVCRICHGSTFTPVLDLGHTPPADSFLTYTQLSQPETWYPLCVVRCTACHLVQLTYTVPRGLLYSADYPYVSSTTETGRKHYHDMAASIVERFAVHGGLAVD